MRWWLLWIAGWCGGGAAMAQFTYRAEGDVPVEISGRPLAMPWAGGLNSAQVNTLDLTGDGLEDVVIFDRTSNKIHTFVRTATGYRYDPQYEDQFPPEVSQWMLLRDFNCDGRKDIFTSDPFGMRVFVNITPPGGPLRWREFNPGMPLLTVGFSGTINLQVSALDMPAIEDIDGDGDLDILNLRFVGANTIEWHRNLSKERTGTCDSLQLERVTQTWGQVEECGCEVFSFQGNPPCTPSPAGRNQHTGGRALLTLDVTGNGTRDLLFTEEECFQLYQLPNTGTGAVPVFSSSSSFPTGNPAHLIFPAPYLENVTGDPTPELILSPNQAARTLLSTDFAQSLYLYRNTGTAHTPLYELQQRDFLQADMIDVGDFAAPAFLDVDGDGDYDLLVGQFIGTAGVATLRYYENTGTAAVPSFRWITDDFIQLSDQRFFNLKPHVADFNRDGRPDLMLVGTRLQNGVTSLHWVANVSTGGGFQPGDLQSLPVAMAQNENAWAVDVNEDGLTDVLVGRSSGALHYLRHVGTAALPAFQLESTAFLGIGSSTERQFPSVFTADLDADGADDLLMGTSRGVVSLYSNFRAGSSQPLTEWLWSESRQGYITKNLGGRLSVAPAPLWATARPAFAVGTAGGGVLLFRNEDGTALPEQPQFALYPNPVRRGQPLFVRTDRPAVITFYTAIGQPLQGPMPALPFRDVPLPMELPVGLYLVRVETQGRTFTRRVVVTD